MDFQQIKELDGEYLAKTYARYPVALCRRQKCNAFGQ